MSRREIVGTTLLAAELFQKTIKGMNGLVSFLIYHPHDQLFSNR